MLSEANLRGARLCVVGNINRDVKTAPLPSAEALLSDGETGADAITETIGGGGANSAFAAAALGGRVTFVGKVGADALGDRLERTLVANGLAARLTRDPRHPSGTSLALAFADGHRHFISHLPASRALAFEDIDLTALDGQDHLLRADIWFSEAMLFGGNQRLFETALAKGVPVSIDLNWDPDWGRASTERIRARKRAVREALPGVTLAHGNVRELTEFADAPDLSSALQRITGWGARAVVVHLGAEGAGWYSEGSWVTVPPCPVSRHVNTTGTGDVLSVCAMLLHPRAEAPPAERLALANAIVAEFIEGRRTLIPPLSD